MQIATRRVTIILGVVLAAIFAWLAVRDADLTLIGTKLADANLLLIPPFFVSLALFYWLKAQRWGVILDGANPLPPRRLLPSMMIGFAGNNVLPLRLGEIVRIYLAGLDLGMSKSRILGSMVLERAFDAATILVLLAVVTTRLAPQSDELDAARLVLMIGTAVAILGIYGLVFTPKWLRSIAELISRPLPKRTREYVAPRIAQLREGFSVLRQGRQFLSVLVNSFVQWLLLACCVYLSIAAFDIDITPLAAVVVMGLIIAGISLPAAPGFIGTIEYCFVAGLSFFDVNATDALSIAIFYHVLMFVGVVTVGAGYLRRYGLSWRQLKADANRIKTT